MGRLAEGENAIEVPGTERGDEVGGMAKGGAGLPRCRGRQGKGRCGEAGRRCRAERIVDTPSLPMVWRAWRRATCTAEISSEFAPDLCALKINFNSALGALRNLIGFGGGGCGEHPHRLGRNRPGLRGSGASHRSQRRVASRRPRRRSARWTTASRRPPASAGRTARARQRCHRHGGRRPFEIADDAVAGDDPRRRTAPRASTRSSKASTRSPSERGCSR